ncbi:hypothetical protein DYB32_007303 [Aphanomyces invadans]|uniref:Beta-lactamase-related domain-containing protein n=1 Tax=Aphanomyces invadans TaxID=157072 RepID=A0A3R7CWX6_9STRA|nr:hypothetical protein DYB32_007303 [Aphanomyces invadans]
MDGGTGRSVVEKKAQALAFVDQQLRANPTIPGLAFSVVYKHDTVIAQGLGTMKAGNPHTPVTPSSMFQIGSFSKTFIALGIAKLVDDGVMTWTDPVVQHLPWLKLQDTYAEMYTTLGDLLSMNSGLGAFDGDEAFAFGLFPTERAVVEHLSQLNSTRALRSGYAYSNMNFEILGQVIEQATNETWPAFLKKTIWDPLGMNQTFAASADAGDNVAEMSHGHMSCGSKVIGPFDTVTDSMAMLTPSSSGHLAAGSVVSSANDLATFTRFLLSDGRALFKSATLLDDITTGHTALDNMVVVGNDAADALGYSFHPGGNTIAAGYGIDVVGHVMFGYDFFTKNGDTATFKERNGFVPSQGLGVVLVSNSNSLAPEGSAASFLLDRIRSYVLGIFLDVPQADLDAMWNQAISRSNQIQPDNVGHCDARYFDGAAWNKDNVAIPRAIQAKVVGSYVAVASPGFYGHVELMQRNGKLYLHYGSYNRELFATADPAMFIWDVRLAAETIWVQLADIESPKATVSLMGMLFVRDA